MAPFRPTHINKRTYPGNANVIGPTRQATLGLSTTTCFSSTNVCGACQNYPLNLGCRCSYCACPCCNVCCSCSCTVCTQTVPSGIWNSFEQYEASTRGAWGSGSTSSSGTATCLCCTSVGFACTTNIVDCKGFFICCGPTTNKWFVAPQCTEVSRPYVSRNDTVTVANSLMGTCGWFVPSNTQMSNPGFVCRTYWDTLDGAGQPYYWTTFSGCSFNMRGGYLMGSNNNFSYRVRSFRCTAT
jgi:hypothetical protein